MDGGFQVCEGLAETGVGTGILISTQTRYAKKNNLIKLSFISLIFIFSQIVLGFDSLSCDTLNCQQVSVNYNKSLKQKILSLTFSLNTLVYSHGIFSSRRHRR